MSVEKRVAEILRAVDEMLRRITRWMGDPEGGPVVPENVRLAIESTALTCESGKIPACCRDLAIVAVPRLLEEFRAYNLREYGKVRLESGAPGPSFWGAVKAVVAVRAEAEAPVVERLEPVSVLLGQGVSYDQIARHIYGRRGVGPFIQHNGAPDVALIEKEAREPGSVIGSDWIPPWHEQSMELRRKEMASKLKSFDRLECATEYDDPATVEEMLRDGAFVQQIQRAKGVTRDQVMAEARRIGIAAADGPGYHPENREDSDTNEFDEDEDDATAEWKANRHALRELVIEYYTKSNGMKSAAEIATEVRQLGHDIKTNAVSTMIARWKMKTTREITSAPA